MKTISFLILVVVGLLSCNFLFAEEVAVVTEKSTVSPEALVIEEKKQETCNGEDTVISSKELENLSLQRDVNETFFQEHPDATSGSASRQDNEEGK